MLSMTHVHPGIKAGRAYLVFEIFYAIFLRHLNAAELALPSHCRLLFDAGRAALSRRHSSETLGTWRSDLRRSFVLCASKTRSAAFVHDVRAVRSVKDAPIRRFPSLSKSASSRTRIRSVAVSKRFLLRQD